jgi:hypothetical protein
MHFCRSRWPRFCRRCRPPRCWTRSTKPLDYSKQADVNGKTVTFGDLHYGTVSQPTRPGSTTSPLSKGDLQLHRMELNEVNLKSVDMSTVSEPVLPQVNFTAKRAAADKVNDQGSRQLDQTRQKAPITSRQIRPFTPGGEEELKKQLKYSIRDLRRCDIIHRLNL